jgi:hypothetical protein
MMPVVLMKEMINNIVAGGIGVEWLDCSLD